MLTNETAHKIAQEWVTAWNNHDMAAIMGHYADDIEFVSPFIVAINNDDRGMIKGKAALHNYFVKALEKYPELHFDLYHVLVSINSIVVYYQSVAGKLAAEYMELDTHHKIISVKAHYTN